MTQEATSVSEPKLPSELEAAINESNGAAVLASRYPEYSAKADAARAALVSAVLKYGDEQRSEGYKLGAKVIEVAGHD